MFLQFFHGLMSTMAQKVRKKVTTVRAHTMHVPVSKKNPSGLTIRDRHQRRLKGTSLNRDEIETVLKNYNRKNSVYPTKGRLPQPDSDKYDDVIAVWVDYFNKKFNATQPLDPDVVKALIASESDFRKDPPGNPKATGIIQITPETFQYLQDPKGEAKEFIFKDIRKKDLKDPSINIPMGIRWLFRKNATARAKLGREPTHEELILEYKGLLKSKSEYKNSALKKYRKAYASLKKK